MKLDLLYEIQPRPKPWLQPHPYGQRAAEQSAFFEAIEQVQLADTLGFNTAWFVEHHFRDGRSACPSNEVVLGALASTTENIRLGFGVSLMPFGFQHPARVAEKVATVDILSHGRVEWGTGRSTPMEQTAFGVPIDERSRAQWREAVEIVVGMWESERFSWNSETITIPERIQTPKPFQDPHPPCWLAGATETSAVVAGQSGLGLLSFGLFQPLDKVAAVVDIYRQAQQQMSPLTRIINDRSGVYTLVHCCDDMDEAASYGLWESLHWWYRNIAEFTLEWELPNASDEEKERMFPHLQAIVDGDVDVDRFHDQDMIIVGTPEMCLEKMLRWESAGVDQLLCSVQWGDLPADRVNRCLQLLSTEVMPELYARGHRADGRPLPSPSDR
jgi:alkanesulfonate monooxygenase SsuD/methylene tetrahydromethanopterin reductase-like flavin-dependent oxidoreductase (luciferase family)